MADVERANHNLDQMSLARSQFRHSGSQDRKRVVVECPGWYFRAEHGDGIAPFHAEEVDTEFLVAAVRRGAAQEGRGRVDGFLELRGALLVALLVLEQFE